MAIVDISKKDKAAVLAVLYNYARPLNLGYYMFNPSPMSIEEAREILASGRTYFDYHKGRVMKISLEGDIVDTRLYDIDNGEGAGERLIRSIPDTK